LTVLLQQGQKQLLLRRLGQLQQQHELLLCPGLAQQLHMLMRGVGTPVGGSWRGALWVVGPCWSGYTKVNAIAKSYLLISRFVMVLSAAP
jgi:hypothetical protein